MVRRSETFGTLGRITAAKEAAKAIHQVIPIVDSNADDDFPELNR